MRLELSHTQDLREIKNIIKYVNNISRIFTTAEARAYAKPIKFKKTDSKTLSIYLNVLIT